MCICLCLNRRIFCSSVCIQISSLSKLHVLVLGQHVCYLTRSVTQVVIVKTWKCAFKRHSGLWGREEIQETAEGEQAFSDCFNTATLTRSVHILLTAFNDGVKSATAEGCWIVTIQHFQRTFLWSFLACLLQEKSHKHTHISRQDQIFIFLW